MSEQSAAFFDRVFAVVIAFCLPGLIVLFGVGTVYVPVRDWFTGAQSNPTLAGLAFVMMAALALNLVVTSVRWMIFERIRCMPARSEGEDSSRRRVTLVPEAPDYDESQRLKRRRALRELTHDYYYHYLAYANTAVALPAAVALWLFGATMPWFIGVAVIVGTLVTACVLGAAACDAVRRYDRSASKLLGVRDGEVAGVIAPGPPTDVAVAAEEGAVVPAAVAAVGARLP